MPDFINQFALSADSGSSHRNSAICAAQSRNVQSNMNYMPNANTIFSAILPIQHDVIYGFQLQGS
jgi:hypothetical protein